MEGLPTNISKNDCLYFVEDKLRCSSLYENHAIGFINDAIAQQMLLDAMLPMVYKNDTPVYLYAGQEEKNRIGFGARHIVSAYDHLFGIHEYYVKTKHSPNKTVSLMHCLTDILQIANSQYDSEDVAIAWVVEKDTFVLATRMPFIKKNLYVLCTLNPDGDGFSVGTLYPISWLKFKTLRQGNDKYTPISLIDGSPIITMEEVISNANDSIKSSSPGMAMASPSYQTINKKIKSPNKPKKIKIVSLKDLAKIDAVKSSNILPYVFLSLDLRKKIQLEIKDIAIMHYKLKAEIILLTDQLKEMVNDAKKIYLNLIKIKVKQVTPPAYEVLHLEFNSFLDFLNRAINLAERFYKFLFHEQDGLHVAHKKRSKLFDNLKKLLSENHSIVVLVMEIFLADLAQLCDNIITQWRTTEKQTLFNGMLNILCSYVDLFNLDCYQTNKDLYSKVRTALVHIGKLGDTMLEKSPQTIVAEIENKLQLEERWNLFSKKFYVPRQKMDMEEVTPHLKNN